jgi:hypothetical protein
MGPEMAVAIAALQAGVVHVVWMDDATGEEQPPAPAA